MNDLAQIKLYRQLLRVSACFAIAIIVISLLVLLGWQLDIPFLRRPFPMLVSMNPLTAVCLAITSVLLLFTGRSKKGSSKAVVANVAAIMVVLAALIKLFSFADVNVPDIDSFLYTEKVDSDLFNGQPSRMAPNTAVCFVLAGLSLILLNYKTARGYMPAQFMSFLLLLIGIFSVLGYLYRVKAFYGMLDYIPMAVHTAFCFILLAFAILFKHPDKGFMRDIAELSTGGTVARILIPLAILVPACLGLLRTYAVRMQLFSSELGTAIHVSCVIIIFLVVTWYVAVLLNRKHRQRELAEKKVEKSKIELEKLNEELETQVRLKTIEIRDIFQRVSDVFYAVDTEDRFTFVNKQAAKVFGLNNDDVIGKKMWDFFPKETVSKEFLAAYEAAITTQQPQVMEGFSKLAGRWFLVNIYPSRGGVSLILQDITEKRKAEEQVQKEKNFSESIIKSLPGIFYSFDDQGKFLKWNRNFEIVSGYSGDEISNMTPDQFFDNDEKEYLRGRMAKVFADGYSDAEAYFLSKNGTKTYFYFTGVRSEFDGRPCLTGVGFDIAERKQAEQSLRLSESKYRLLFEWNPIPMWMLSLPEFRFIDVNNAAVRHYGYSREEFLSMHAGDIRSREEAERLRSEIHKHYPDVTNAGIWKHIKKNKQPVIVEIITHDIQFGDRPVRLVLANDVTEKIKAHEALEASNEALRELTSHLQQVREDERKHIAREIHDELGQQLTVIKMDVSWIKKKLDPTNQVLAEKTNELLSLLDDTVKTVRDLSSRLRPSLLDDLGLIAAIEWHLNDFRQRTGLGITAHLPEYSMDLPDYVATALFRIMQESLTNVARHSGAKNVTVRLEEAGDNIVMSIKDDGRGYREDIASGKKTLGILGMKERAAMIGGVYNIEGTPGGGTEVSVAVPIPQYSSLQNKQL